MGLSFSTPSAKPGDCLSQTGVPRDRRSGAVKQPYLEPGPQLVGVAPGVDVGIPLSRARAAGKRPRSVVGRSWKSTRTVATCEKRRCSKQRCILSRLSFSPSLSLPTASRWGGVPWPCSQDGHEVDVRSATILIESFGSADRARVDDAPLASSGYLPSCTP